MKVTRTKERTVRGVRPNLGLELWYRTKLLCFIDAMQASIVYWLSSAYKRHEPVMAEDAKPRFGSVVRDAYRGTTYEVVKLRLGAGEQDYYSVYVGAVGTTIRNKQGVGRRWSSQGAAENAAKKVIDEAHDVKEQTNAEQRKDRRRIADKGLPADELQKAVRRLSRRWQRSINRGAEDLADHFAQAAADRGTRQLKTILGKAGIAVPFRMTPAQRDIIKSTVHANVALIRSIPAKHFAGVEQIVMESVQTGRDLGSLSKKLQRQFGVTKRRAALIARDQNSKATCALTRARQSELGITKARWKHSRAKKHPRKSHIAADGKLYDIKVGMLIDGEYIFPGEKINCGCTSQSVIPGFVH